MISPTELKKIQSDEQARLDSDIKSCLPAMMQTIEAILIKHVKEFPETLNCYIEIDSLIDPNPSINTQHARTCFLRAVTNAIKEAGYNYSFDSNKSHITITWR